MRFLLAILSLIFYMVPLSLQFLNWNGPFDPTQRSCLAAPGETEPRYFASFEESKLYYHFTFFLILCRKYDIRVFNCHLKFRAELN